MAQLRRMPDDCGVTTNRCLHQPVSRHPCAAHTTAIPELASAASDRPSRPSGGVRYRPGPCEWRATRVALSDRAAS